MFIFSVWEHVISKYPYKKLKKASKKVVEKGLVLEKVPPQSRQTPCQSKYLKIVRTAYQTHIPPPP